MTQNLGSFSFDVSVSIGAAQANLQKLVQAAQQTAQQVQQAFSGTQLKPIVFQANASQVVAAAAQAKAAVKGVTDGAARAVEFRANAAQFSATAERVLHQVRQISDAKVSTTLRVDATQGAAALSRAEAQVKSLKANERITLHLVVPADQANIAVARLKASINESLGNVKLVIDTEAAEKKLTRLDEQKKRIFERDNPIHGPADPSTAAGARQLSQFQREQTQVTVRANFSEVEKGFDHIAARARELGNARFNLSVDANGSKQATAAIRQMAQALREAKAGEHINIDVQATSIKHATAAAHELEGALKSARAAGVHANVNIQTSRPQGGFLQQAGAGFLQQATPGLATGAAAAAGVVAAQAVGALAHAMGEAIAAGVRYNGMLERSAVQLKVFTGSGEVAEEMLKRLRRFADITPFNTDEVIEAGAAFARLGGTVEQTMARVQRAGQLAAVNPDASRGGGLEGATLALLEARSGDFTSIQRRFNVPPATIAAIKALGLSADETEKALVKAAGGSDKLVAALGDTFEGRLSTATSALQNLGAVATKPIFDTLSEGLARFTALVDQNRGPLEAYATALGKLIAANPTIVWNPGAFVGSALAAGIQARSTPPTPETGLSPEAQQQGRLAPAGKAVEAAEKPLTAQRKLLEDNKDRLEQIQLVAKQVTAAYEEQLRPLEQQQRALQGQQRENEAKQRAIAQRVVDAGPSVGVRATAAFDTTILDHEQELTDIRHRRAELSEQIAKAEEAAATRVAEAQIRGAERALQATQQRAQAESEARQVALEGLREEVRGRQEARQAALEGLREYIQGLQEARREAIDGIREEMAARQEQRREAISGLQEEIRVRRETYDDARTVAQEANRDRQEAFADQQRAADRGHQTVMDHYRDQIESLRDQTEERKVQSREAERALEAFNAQDRERQRSQSLRGAENQVLRARTGAARRDALEHLADLRADQAADRQREALQAKVAAEQKAADEKRATNADKIAALERKARDEDRTYQRQKDAQTEAFRIQQRQQELADRAAEKVEREVRRNEDNQVRALEKADRELTKIEQTKIKALEKADREQTKIENAQIRNEEKNARDQDRRDQALIRAQEKIDRDLDRKAQKEILDQQQKILDARNTLTDRKEGFDAVLDAVALGRLREQTDLENRRIDIRNRLAKATDVLALAEANRDKVVADDEGRIIASGIATVEGRLAVVKTAMETALTFLGDIINGIEIRIAFTKEEIKDLEKRVTAAKDALKEAGKPLFPTLSDGPKGDEAGPRTNPPSPVRAPSTGFSDPATGQTMPPPPRNGRPDISLGGNAIVAGIEGAIGPTVKAIWDRVVDALSGGGTTPPPGAIVGIANIGVGLLTAGLTQAGEDPSVAAAGEGAVTEGFNAGQAPVTPGASALGQALTAALNGAWSEAVETADAIPTEIAAHITNGIDAAFAGLSASIGTALTAALNSGWAQATPTADAIPGEIGSHISGSLETAFATLGAQIGTALETALNAGWTQAFPVADSISTEIAAHIAAGEGLKTLGVTLGTALMTALQAAWEASVELTDSIGTEIATHIVTAFSTGFTDQQQTILDALAVPFSEDAIGGVVEQAEDVAAKAWAKLPDDIKAHHREIVDALEDPFIEVTDRYFPAAELKFKRSGNEHADAYLDGFKAFRLVDKIRAEIDAIIRMLHAKIPRFTSAGTSAGNAFHKAFCAALDGMANCVGLELQKTEQIAKDFGESAGRQFSAGFAQTARTPMGGSGGGSGSAGGGNYYDYWRLDPRVADGSQMQLVRHYVDGREQVIGSAPTDPSKLNRVVSSVGGSGTQQVQARASGGPFGPGWLLAGEGGPELIKMRGAGSVMPAGLTAKTLAGVGASGGNRTNITVTLHQNIQAAPGMNTKALAQMVTDQAVNAIIGVLDQGEIRSPNPVSRLLPGAL